MSEPYATPAGVESAIKEAAQRAAATDPSLNARARIRIEHFDRFLSRVFSEAEESSWVLEGGTGLLARVPSARATIDVDLHRREISLDSALRDLRRLAEIDLGDHFRFVYRRHDVRLEGEGQPYADGCRVVFDVYIGAARKSPLKIDMVTGAGITAPIDSATPATALDLPRLIKHPYRLYPVVDQIADKVCASLTTYDGVPSSREKDLVDLVVLARTQNMAGTELHRAITTEANRRRMTLPQHFGIPSTWGRGYTKLAHDVPHCHGMSVSEAQQLVAQLIDPALGTGALGRTWSHEIQRWH